MPKTRFLYWILHNQFQTADTRHKSETSGYSGFLLVTSYKPIINLS